MREFVIIGPRLKGKDEATAAIPYTELSCYLQANPESCERTLPLTPAQAEAVKMDLTDYNSNCIYMDLDGKLGQMLKASFEATVKRVHELVYEALPTCVVMDASAFACVKGKATNVNVLSLRVQFPKVHGTREDICLAVHKVHGPKIAEALADEHERDANFPLIRLGIDSKFTSCIKRNMTEGEGELHLDSSVYGTGRKMRMLGCLKPLDMGTPRPFTIVLCAGREIGLLDTLITFKPADSVTVREAHPEAFEEALNASKPEAPKRKRDASPKRDAQQKRAIPVTRAPKKQAIAHLDVTIEQLEEAVRALNPARFKDREARVTLNILCRREKLSFALWNEVTSAHITDAAARKAEMKDHAKYETEWSKPLVDVAKPLTLGTLWSWLWEDAPHVYQALAGQQRPATLLLLNDSDYDCAKAFKSLCPDKYLYDHESNLWFSSTSSGHWAQSSGIPVDMTHAITTTLREFVSECTNEEIREKFKWNVGSMTRVNSIAPFLKNFYACDDAFGRMDSKCQLLAFEDAVVDLDKMEVRPIAPDDFVTKSCGYNFPESDPVKRAYLMEKLSTVYEDPATLNFVLDQFAAALHGRNPLGDVFLWLNGPGRNGKGLFLALLEAALGGTSNRSYFGTLSGSFFTQEKASRDAPDPQLFNCKGKRITAISEIPGNKPLLTDEVTRLTGGDPQSVRTLHGKPTIFVPQFTPIFATNPTLRFDTVEGPALQERLAAKIEHPFTFVRDPEPGTFQRQLDESLRAELKDNYGPEFMCLLLDKWAAFPKPMPKGYLGILRSAAPAVEASTAAFWQEANPVASWLASAYERVPELDKPSDGCCDYSGKYYPMGWVPASTLYTEFLSSERSQMSKNVFEQRMRQPHVLAPKVEIKNNKQSCGKVVLSRGTYYTGLQKKD